MRKILLLTTILLLLFANTAFANSEPSGVITIAEDGFSFIFTGENGALAYEYEVGFCDGTATLESIKGDWLSELSVSFDKEIAYVVVGFKTEGYWDEEDDWYLRYDHIYVSRECSPELPPNPPTITIADDGMTADYNEVAGYWVWAVYAEDCYGNVDELELEEPWYDFGWTTIPEEGGGPLGYLAALVAYFDGEEWSEAFWIDASRDCVPEPEAAQILFTMWLLTGPNVERAEPGVGYSGNACMLISDSHPSVERQNAACFPINDPDWQATNVLCAGAVYDDGTWACDEAMHEFNPVLRRLPLYSEDGNDLWHAYLRWLSHTGQGQ
jgi:hypothetical protein